MKNSFFNKNIIYMLILKVLRIYTVYFPINRGKGKIIKFEELLISNLDSLIAVSKDNRKFFLKLPEDRIRSSIFTTGYCEKDVTELFRKIINKDDIIFDVGANIGWYATLFACNGAECHAFEPNPQVFDRLVRNCGSNISDNHKLFLNKIALGSEKGTVSFYNFRNLHHGLSSLSDFGRDDKEEVKVKCSTLSEYVIKNEIKKVDLIKVDVEGSELPVLKGSESMLSKGYTPIWVFEMNDETSKHFNYSPSDILQILQKYGYSFYRIEKRLKLMQSIYDYYNGTNVLCIMPRIHEKRL